MTPQEFRYAEIINYISNPRNRKYFPRCVAARERELKRMSITPNNTQ